MTTKRFVFSVGTALLAAVLTLVGTLWLLAASPVTAALPSPAAPDHTETISRAVAFMATQVFSDGSLSGDPFASIKGTYALAAVGLPQATLAHSQTGRTPLDFLRSQAVTYTADAEGAYFPGRLGMLAVAAVAADAHPGAFGSVDLPGALASTYHPSTGAYSTTASAGWTTGAASTVNQLWAILGLAAAQQPVPAPAVHFLLDLQETDGGWGYGFGGDVDATALVIQALLASEQVTPTHPAILAATTFLRQNQDADGAWGYSFGGVYSISADTTASVIQALAALGYTPADATWAKAAGNPHTALAAMQAADGSFSANALGTAHAIAGLSEAPLPIAGRAQRADLALTWMHEQQLPDGAWGFWGTPSAGATLDAVLAYAAAGYDPATVTPTGGTRSALAYLGSQAYAYTHDITGTVHPASAGKLLLGVVASGADPTAFDVYPTAHISAGLKLNLVTALRNTYQPATGAYSSTAVKDAWTNGNAGVVNQSWAMLGLAAAGETLPEPTVAFLVNLQLSDGSWGGVDNTGIAAQALLAAGEPATATAIVSATAYLKAQQDAAGGWGNANSTAYAIQALLAAGQDLWGARWQVNGRSPVQALLAYQKPDGPFAYQWQDPTPYWNPTEDNGMATWQAIPALVGVSYPYQPAALRPFVDVVRGLDPDRFVPGPITYSPATQQLAWTFGSDLDRNAVVTGTWAVETTLLVPSAPFTLTRAPGRFVATLSLTRPATYILHLYAADSSGVQGEALQTYRIALRLQNIFLPLVLRSAP
ncbi:MAG TPA: prenyltransferase/squalene oxidase repeat-containing protein [Anaerolineae bacterium]|nr:prenyltransferase/squalene oxidase repeat-containing protein [Anaerolineae bacterium]